MTLLVSMNRTSGNAKCFSSCLWLPQLTFLWRRSTRRTIAHQTRINKHLFIILSIKVNILSYYLVRYRWNIFHHLLKALNLLYVSNCKFVYMPPFLCMDHCMSHWLRIDCQLLCFLATKGRAWNAWCACILESCFWIFSPCLSGVVLTLTKL